MKVRKRFLLITCGLNYILRRQELSSIIKRSMKNRLILFLLLIIVGISLAGIEHFVFKRSHINTWQAKLENVIAPKDVYAQFTGEVWDLIKNEHWEELSDNTLAERFLLASRELGYSQFLETQDKEGVQKLVMEATANMDTPRKKEFTVKMADLVLQSLRPNTRSRLYAQVNEEALKNLVSNVDPKTDQYQVLGVAKDAPQEEVKQTYERKVEEVKQEATTPAEAKTKVAEVTRAYEALKTPERREIYDKYKIEPTVGTRFIKPGILYLPIKRISPQTFQEFVNEVNNLPAEKQRDALILDLRGNIGGSIDILPQFLGPFIGQNQYAFEFFRRDKPLPVKTTTGWLPNLVPYKNVVVLVDKDTQSSAELIASVLKKYNVGVVVGTKTRGWGTIEKVFKLQTQLDPTETYSLFLVHTLTLRDDGQPVEGRGIEPMIDIQKEGWEKDLDKYFHRQDLIEAVKSLVTES